MGFWARLLVSFSVGGFVLALAAANFAEVGVLIGAVFGLATAYLVYELLTRRAEARLTREKWKDYE